MSTTTTPSSALIITGASVERGPAGLKAISPGSSSAGRVRARWSGKDLQAAIEAAGPVLELRDIEVTEPWDSQPKRGISIDGRHFERLVIQRCTFFSGLRLKNLTVERLIIEELSCRSRAGQLRSVTLRDCAVDKRATFTTFRNDTTVDLVRFRQVEFARGIDIVAGCDRIDLTGTVFGEPSSLSASADAGGRPAIESLSMASVTDLSLHGLDLRECRFRGAHGLDSTTFTDCRWRSSPGFAKRRVVYEEAVWRSQWPTAASGRGLVLANVDSLSSLPAWPPRRWQMASPTTRSRRITAWQVEEVYRALEKGARAQGNHAVAADYAWGEYTMRRLAGRERQPSNRVARTKPPIWNPSPFKRRGGTGDRGIVRLYRVFGGYGLRARWPLFWLAASALVVAYALGRWGFSETGQLCGHANACWGKGRSDPSIERFLNALSATSGYVFSLTKPDTNDVAGWVPGFLTLSKVGAVLLVGFAGVALRSRVRR